MRAILTYHSIDPSGSPISCHPDAFARHLGWLRAGPVTVTSIEDLLARPPTDDAVAITFDDAFVSFGEVAAPRLIELGLPCTVFVVTDRTGGTNAWGTAHLHGVPEFPLLDWRSLRRLQGLGIAIGSHTRTHRDLTALDAPSIADEIRTSADIIEGETGHRPTSFAYPYGRVDDRAAAAAGAAYRCACTTELRALDAVEDRSRLPRLDAYYFQAPGTLESWGSPRFGRFVRHRRRLRRMGELARALRAVASRPPRA